MTKGPTRVGRIFAIVMVAGLVLGLLGWAAVSCFGPASAVESCESALDELEHLREQRDELAVKYVVASQRFDWVAAERHDRGYLKLHETELVRVRRDAFENCETLPQNWRKEAGDDDMARRHLINSCEAGRKWEC